MYVIKHLPRKKAAGSDEVTYEMMAASPPEQLAILLAGINQVLSGGEIPSCWKGGLLRLLSKREPAYLIENMRPVTLQQTVYKLTASVVAFRLQRVAEKAGVLESTQHGFRTQRQTHQAILKVKYAMEEARKTKGKIYLTYLDWFGAFGSVPTQLMFEVLREMNMADEDVRLLRVMFDGAWQQVDTPFGRTAKIPVERGTAQGNPLSPILFLIFLNLCLRHLLDAGVGVVHAARTEKGDRVRQNHAAFADDVVLLATKPGDMNLLLDRVREFSAWSGMELCLLKC
jgi:hypothetical protein